MAMNSVFIFLIQISLLTSLGWAQDGDVVMKITNSNLKGQVALYNEGWLLIPSAKKSLEYCQEKSIGSAKEAMQLWGHSLIENASELKQSLKDNPELAKKIFQVAQKISKQAKNEIQKSTNSLMKSEYAYAMESFQGAWEKVLLGTIHLNQLTRNDRERIAAKILGLPSDIKDDMNNVKRWLTFLREDKGHEVSKVWDEAIQKASDEWQKEYEKSGQKENTLAALPHVIWGNLKAIWYGVFKPSAHTVGDTMESGGKKISNALLLPVASLVMIGGRTVYNLGGALFYTGGMGTRIVANTLQAGFLSAMGTLSLASTAPTFLSGQSIAYINQVALTTVGVGAAGTGFVAATTVESASHVGLFSYDVVRSTGKVILGVGSSTIVLGYNALTALPAQVFLSAVNGVVFLAWDGPRLVLYKVSGKVNGADVQELPVGAIVDQKQLEKAGLAVEKLSEDPAVIEKVLEKMPEDMRERNE